MGYYITYMGHVLDECMTSAEASERKVQLVGQIMADKLPDFLTSEDFENRADCVAQIRIERAER